MKGLYLFVALLVLSGTVAAQQNTSDDTDDSTAMMRDVRTKLTGIKDIIQENYETLLLSVPDASGTVTVSFTILPDGSVADVSVECPEQLSDIRENVLPALNALEFGTELNLNESVPVTVPFALAPPEQEGSE